MLTTDMAGFATAARAGAPAAPAAPAAHPTWCDPDQCSAERVPEFGSHLSTPEHVPADRPVATTVGLFWMALPDGATPLLGLEVDGADGEEPVLCPLTVGQVRQLHDALTRLLAAVPAP